MNAAEFVAGLRQAVLDGVVDDVATVVRSPPGRRPSNELTELSSWFSGLTTTEKAMVNRILNLAVRHTAFGILAVLDGSRAVNSSSAPHYFELRYVEGEEEVILSGPRGSVLHELL